MITEVIKSFVKLEELHETTSDIDTAIDFCGSDDEFLNKIEVISKNSIIGLIGGFGLGKSVFLNEVRKKSEEKGNFWVQFDAWKFPERKDLWEGFVLEFARQLSPGAFKKTLAEIDGKEFQAEKTATGILADTLKYSGLPLIGSVGAFVGGDTRRINACLTSNKSLSVTRNS